MTTHPTHTSPLSIPIYLAVGSFFLLLGGSPSKATLKGTSVCRVTSPYESLIQKIGRETGLDPRLLKAVITAESQFKAREISPAGACGLMQLMPQTARLFAVTDIFDPEQNIRAGAKHLRYLLTRYSNDMTLSLAAYNAGELPVLHYKGIPPYPETQHYVRRVIRLYNAYRSYT